MNPIEDLRNDLALLKARHGHVSVFAKYLTALDALKARAETIEAENAELRKALYGVKCEDLFAPAGYVEVEYEKWMASPIGSDDNRWRYSDRNCSALLTSDEWQVRHDLNKEATRYWLRREEAS